MLFIIILKRIKDDVIFACFSVTCRFHCSIFAASLSATQPEKRKVTFHSSAVCYQDKTKTRSERTKPRKAKGSSCESVVRHVEQKNKTQDLKCITLYTYDSKPADT